MADGDVLATKTLAVRTITELAGGKVRLEFRPEVSEDELKRAGAGPVAHTVYQEDVDAPDEAEPYRPGEIVTISITRGGGQ